MSDLQLPSCDSVDAALVRHRIGVDAPELHGLTTGFLAAGGTLSDSGWLAQLHVDADVAAVPDDAVLKSLLHVTRFALDDPELGFALLLPAEDTPLPERVEALFVWCRSFLSGFGLVTPAPELVGDAAEALEEIGRIAEFRVSDEEQDEHALIEISEFVRVAVLLIHGDTRPPRGPNTRLH